MPEDDPVAKRGLLVAWVSGSGGSSVALTREATGGEEKVGREKIVEAAFICHWSHAFELFHPKRAGDGADIGALHTSSYLILGPKGRAVYPLHTPTQVSLVEGLAT